jgi:putative ABC transport system permease protein
MGIPLIKGRTFTEQDRAGAPAVVLINETLARRYWPNEDPIGKRIGNNDPNNRAWREIVGVVGNVKFFGLEQEQPPAVYFPMAQAPERGMTLVVRTSADIQSSAPALRREVWSIDKDLAVTNIVPMEQYLSDAMERPRLILSLLAIFAVLALVLAAIGIYGVMAYAVSQRTHEIGVRMALGARSEDVLKLILKEGLVLGVLGVGAGLAGAIALTRLLESLLFGVSTTDPITFTAVSLVSMLVAIAACWIPARRATRVDPMVALRYE